MRLFTQAVGAMGILCLLASSGQAKPEYAAREKKACDYCHLNPMGGGARNPRGLYYAAHNHTFKDYNEAKVMGKQDQKKTGPPAFQSAWKMDLPEGTRRIAIGDVADDKKPRLLALGKETQLTVHNLTGSAPSKEETLDLGANAANFVVGKFAKDKPALIATTGAVFYRNGDKYARKEIADLKEITGSVRFSDGTENFFFFAGGGQPESWSIDLAAEKPLTLGREMVDPAQGGGVYGSLIAHLSPDVLGGFGIPAEAQKAGVIAIYDPRADGQLFVLVPWQAEDGSYVVLVDGTKIFGEERGDFKPTWKSPKLSGNVLDVVIGADPKGSKKTGFLVLEASGEDGKGRLVEFFALD